MVRPAFGFCVLVLLGTGRSVAADPGPWSPAAADIRSQCASVLLTLRSAGDEVANARAHARFSSTVLKLEDAVADARDALATPLFLADVASDAAVRDASYECRVNFFDAIAELNARPDVYAALVAGSAKKSPLPEDRALSAVWLERFVRGGATLSTDRREEFLRLAQELVETQERYIRQRAQEQLATASDEALFASAIALRDRMAHLSGYESWADYRLAGTTIGSLPHARSFLTAAAQSPQPPDRGAREPALSDTVRRALDLLHAEFRIGFEHLADNQAWNAGVQAFAVTDDASSRRVGTLYLDLFGRAWKSARGATVTILPARGERGAAVALLESWPASLSRAHATIDFDRVKDLLWQLGRATSVLLASTPYETLNDPTAEAKAVTAATVERFARILDGGGADSDPARARSDAETDLDVHSRGPHVDAAGVSQVVRDELMNGCDVRLYTRPWAEAYAGEIFAALTPGDVPNAEDGMRYRSDVLSPARTYALQAELTNFLGHAIPTSAPQ